MSDPAFRIDGPQYCKWTESIFREMRQGGLDAVHVTVSYHEDFRETVERIIDWNRRLERFSDILMPGRTADDIVAAQRSGRTAVFYGFQNASPIEDDIGLIEILHDLGGRFMQLTYNNQSLLAAGCYEREDAGITRMGREVIAEMNRVGMVIDMSHSAERSTLEAIELSGRPICISHANPSAWHPVARNKSDDVLKALAETGGMLGFSLYPLHLRGGSDCTLEEFTAMVARTADLIGVDRIGMGSDLGQGHDDGIIAWMRNGRWTKTGVETPGLGEPKMPPPLGWFRSNADWPGIAKGLANRGFNAEEVGKIMGGNWFDFFSQSFGPQSSR
jgi:microsomal dipeptidase-like Zn-dependent dipeptidase